MKRIMIIACGAALAGATAAGATPSEERLAVHADRAAGCAIERDYRAARELALAEPGSVREANAYTAVAPALRRCFEAQKLGDTPESRALFAGSVARRLYVNTGRFSRTGKTRAVPNLTELTAMVEAWNLKRATTPRDLGALQCAVGRSVEAADALVRSAPGSARERRALPAVTAALAACIELGQQFRMSQPQFRAAMAREFYRYLDLPF
ncbi:MAG TPA: hypothetical protein VE053_03760 [Allosphingosinicella sp.]|nr:hypothetical protein [Allosphingosinicella sp.]